MSVGYLILAHRAPRQILALVRSIRAQSDGPVVIHLDAKSRPFFRRFLKDVAAFKDVVVISRHTVHWGGFSIVEAALSGTRELLDRWPAVTHVKHLSGQDYPLRPLAEFEAWVADLGRRSAIDHWPMPAEHWGPEGGMERVDRVWIYRGKRRVAWPILRRKLPEGVTFYGGSAFWCLSREHLEHVLARRDALADHFRRSFISDETYFPTLLKNSPFRDEVLNKELTLTLWRWNSPSPNILSIWDWKEIEASDAFFGRKFDSFLSSELMAHLDANVLAPRKPQ